MFCLVIIRGTANKPIWAVKNPQIDCGCDKNETLLNERIRIKKRTCALYKYGSVRE